MKCRARALLSYWILNSKISIPVWAARRCHKTGGGWTVNDCLYGHKQAKDGDVVILLEPETGGVVWMTREAFEEEFELVEE